VLLSAALAFAANSQFTLRPQAGLENPKTKISYNNLGYFSPVSQVLPQFSLRADYKFKSRFAPFVGLATNHSLVDYSFSDPENGMSDYKASLGNTQLQLQGGLQYTTKPIYFKKQTSTSKTSKTNTEKSTNTSSKYSSGCSRYSSGCSRYYSCCHGQKSSMTERTKAPNKGWSVALQPSAGFGYVPSNKSDIVSNVSGSQTEYTYYAGNMKTALLTGLGFEFAKNKTRLFTVSVNYFKGLNDNETSFSSQSPGGKTITTTLDSKVSGWNASLGIPIGFTKKTNTQNKAEHKTKSDCQQYRIQYQYKYRCGKSI
jgi:hypothetical protein